MEKWTRLPQGLGVRCEHPDCESEAAHRVDTSEGSFVGCLRHSLKAARDLYNKAQVRN